MAKDFEQGNDGGRMVVDEEQVASYAGETRRGAPCEWPVTRREFVAGATAVFGATTLVPALGRAETVPAVALLGEVQKGSASYVTRDVRKTGRVELTDEEIKERMSGNLCRCGAYPGIVAAVRQAYGHTAGQASAQASTEEMGVTNAVL